MCIRDRYTIASTVGAIVQYSLRNQPGESAHLCSSVIITNTRKRVYPDSIRDLIQIRIAAADSIRDSIRTKISDSQVPIRDL